MFDYKLTITDQIVIMTALQDKAEVVQGYLNDNPTEEYWLGKMEEVRNAYKNISGVEMETPV